MKVETINTAGNWSVHWTESLKKAIQLGVNSHKIGQQLLLENKRVKIRHIELEPGKLFLFINTINPIFMFAIQEAALVLIFLMAL